MKKFLLIALAALMSLTVLTACGETEEEKAAKELEKAAKELEKELGKLSGSVDFTFGNNL